MKKTVKRSHRASVVLRTKNMSVVVYNIGGDYFVRCPELKIDTYQLKATSLSEASKAAMKVVSARASWLERIWKKEIKQLTAETARFVRELEQDAVKTKR